VAQFSRVFHNHMKFPRLVSIVIVLHAHIDADRGGGCAAGVGSAGDGENWLVARGVYRCCGALATSANAFLTLAVVNNVFTRLI